MTSDLDLQFIKDTFKGLRRKFELTERTSDISSRYMDFLDKALLLSHYRSIDYYNAYCFKTSDNYEGMLFTILVLYSIRSGKFDIGGYDIQLLALRELPHPYGHILIRPETVTDKISEWFQHIETDFPANPGFSGNNYFLSDNKMLSNEFATQKRLSGIEKHRDIYIEINGDIMMAKFQRNINFTDGCSLIELMKEI